MNPKKPCDVYWNLPVNIEKARNFTSINQKFKSIKHLVNDNYFKSIKHLVNDNCFFFLGHETCGGSGGVLFK